MFLQQQLCDLNNAVTTLKKNIENNGVEKAVKATQDSEGNVISETYVKKQDKDFLTVTKWDPETRTLYVE